MSMIVHPFPPVYDKHSEILILGSFPSVKSREEQFFYGHPKNRFWKVLAAVFDSSVPESIEDKRSFLMSNRIALWDVVCSCEITGSADSSIKNVIPNDIYEILGNSDIKRIFLNGKTAEKYYNKYIKEKISVEAITLPSTSPANEKWTLEKLISQWSKILTE